MESTEETTELVERVAALDIGKAVLTACIRVPHQSAAGRRRQEVAEYATTTGSLLRLADRLRGLGVTRVAMEATSDYWKPVFYLLEAEGFTFRLTSRADSDAIKRDIKPIYTAVNAAAALAALDDLEEKWGTKYRAMIRLWRNAWTEFIPFLDYDVEIRKVICSTNAIESLNARYRRAVRARGHFPTEQAALKCLYLVTRSLDPTGAGRTRWTMRWKPVLNAFAVTFGDRWQAAELY